MIIPLCSVIAETPESRAYVLKKRVPNQFQNEPRHITGMGKWSCLTLHTRNNKPDLHHYAQKKEPGKLKSKINLIWLLISPFMSLKEEYDLVWPAGLKACPVPLQSPTSFTSAACSSSFQLLALSVNRLYSGLIFRTAFLLRSVMPWNSLEITSIRKGFDLYISILTRSIFHERK